MKKQSESVRNADGRLYVARKAKHLCEGCSFRVKYYDYTACNAPDKTYCDGLIYVPATEREERERTVFDSAVLWLILWLVIQLAAVAIMVMRAIDKWNLQHMN